MSIGGCWREEHGKSRGQTEKCVCFCLQDPIYQYLHDLEMFENGLWTLKKERAVGFFRLSRYCTPSNAGSP